jgi:hypothetical protein
MNEKTVRVRIGVKQFFGLDYLYISMANPSRDRLYVIKSFTQHMVPGA